MKKIIILGAGASKACPYTHDHLPLPLLRELPEIFSVSRINPEAAGHRSFGEHLFRLLEATNGDIEELLTTMFRLDECFFRPERTAGLDSHVIERILSSNTLSAFFDNEADLRSATRVVEMLQTFSGEGDPTRISFGPRNFLTLFRGTLREYFHASIYRQPCPLHMRLFEILDHFDCLVSFNYDDIADYALFASGKLTPQSFRGLGFKTIDLPNATPTYVPFSLPFPNIQYLKLHGSLNWYNHYANDMPNPWFQREGLRPCIEGGPEIHYSLGHEKPLSDDSGNTPDEFLLPFHCKDVIYKSVPMFGRHMHAFRRSLQDANEIWIVGKNFDNSDRELNAFIRYATSDRERTLHIIDPNINVEFHLTLFNARLGRRYSTLQEYAQTN